MIKFEDYIYTDHNALPEDLCKEIIDRFEKDDRKREGHILRRGTVVVDKTLKDSEDLFITALKEWKDIDNILAKIVSENIQNYLDHCYKGFNKLDPVPTPFGSCRFEDAGYNVKSYNPGGYFNWHNDNTQEEQPRMFAMLYYLNDLTNDGGGHTEFADGTSVTPTVGKLVMFPAVWNFIHRGCPPLKYKKYIISTYIH